MTPALSHHARERAAQMHVPTKWIKAMIRNPDICRPSGDGWIAVSDLHPDIAAVYRRHPDGSITVLTIIYRTYDTYDRADQSEGTP